MVKLYTNTKLFLFNRVSKSSKCAILKKKKKTTTQDCRCLLIFQQKPEDWLFQSAPCRPAGSQRLFSGAASQQVSWYSMTTKVLTMCSKQALKNKLALNYLHIHFYN